MPGNSAQDANAEDGAALVRVSRHVDLAAGDFAKFLVAQALIKRAADRFGGLDALKLLRPPAAPAEHPADRRRRKPELPGHPRVGIALSVHILRSAVARCSEARVDEAEVRLALRCLLPHCPERWPLTLYWDAAGQENEIGRAQGVTAAFNGVVRQLRRTRRYDEISSFL